MNEQNWRRIGWRNIFLSAVEAGVFKTENKDAEESVFYGSFERVLRHFSLKNARL